MAVENEKEFHNGLCIVFLRHFKTFGSFPQFPSPYYYNYLKISIYIFIILFLEKRLSK